MGTPISGISILAITVLILVTVPVSSCHRVTIEGNNQSFQPQHNSNSPSTAAAPKESTNNNGDLIFGASRRAIPGGPNPLHN
ncbi:hypothetical protein L6452_25191 [Arctium lappa]|uniref:Uncharacterized protein n=1 Tax=Arctium lappa TaxID=4217 RepID=A0ACB9AAK0_ARCLA|nr:hypothetical protein L6452_25191 [Arctium lappa]